MKRSNKNAIGDSALLFVDVSRLEELRRQQGRTLDDLAACAGIALGTLEHMRGKESRGERIPTWWRNIQAVAGVLSVAPSDLVDWELSKALPGVTEIESTLRAEQQRTLSAAYTALRDYSINKSAAKARGVLEDALANLEPLLREGTCPGIARACALIYSKLAAIEARYERRVALRRAAIDVLRPAKGQPELPDLLTWAEMIANAHFDCSPSLGSSFIGDAIRSALKCLQSAVDKLREEGPATVEMRLQLLAQVLSLTRCRQHYLPNRERFGNLQTVLSLARLCIELAPDHPVALLASGQGRWFVGLKIRNDHSKDNLRLAEEQLRRAAELWTLAALVLARFFRLTYRPQEAIDAFRDFDAREKNRRLVLQEAYIVAEAAQQLWRRKGAAAASDILYAQEVTSEAVEAGFGDARMLCGLAFLEAILTTPKIGTDVLRRMSVPNGGASSVENWDEVLITAVAYAKNQDVEQLRRTFAFGFDTGSVWNSIATYYLDFMKDPELALDLYRAGNKLSPEDHVLWFNQARVLRQLRREAEVSYPLRQAKRFAHTAFDPFFTEFASEPVAPE